MERRNLIVPGAVAFVIGGLAAVASAAPPAGYRCGKGGKPAPASEGCTCPAGKRSSRNAADAAVCAAVRPPVTPVILPPPPPEPTCPSDMVAVHGGTFDMGTPVGGGGDPDEIPVPAGKRTVTLSAFCLDRTEVTVEAYADCVAAGACAPAPDTVEWTGIADADRRLWNDSKLCNANRDDRQSHPVNCVTWDQATTYCTAQQRRLPSEAEWEYAARGSDGRPYPWQAALGAPSTKLFNGCDRECQALGKKLGLTWRAMFADSDDFAATAPVGSYPDGASAFGGLDMAGNVWEWVADEYARYDAGTIVDPAPATTADIAGAKRYVLRGGGWNVDKRTQIRAANRLGLERTQRNSINGFRCARAGG